jgi:hypothetical protein
MDCRRQAAGAGHGIALDFGARSRDRVLLAVETHQVHTVDRAPPMSRAYAIADPHVDARGARAGEQPSERRLEEVERRLDDVEDPRLAALGGELGVAGPAVEVFAGEWPG